LSIKVGPSYKVIEKKEQDAEMCRLLAAEGYDVMLLLVVLGSAGTLLKMP
jgi:hypothetical protein